MSSKISIAQALRRIKKLKGQIAEYTLRAQQSVSYEKTKVPAFRFNESMLARAAALSELLNLQSRVAIANAKATVVDNNESISHSEAIRRLQEMKGEIVFLRGLALRSETMTTRQQDWDSVQEKYVSHVVEVVWLADLSEQDRDRQVRELQDRFEVLNNAIEDHNHKVLV